MGLYGVSTRASYRRRGFGTALVRLSLREAHAQGYRTAVLQASPEGASLYARVGFRELGRIIEYKPVPPEAAA